MKKIIVLAFIFYFVVACTKKEPTAEFKTSPLPQPACFYYGYPSLVNGSSGDLDKAAASLSGFKLVVLGDGLQQPSHPNHQKTQSIVAKLGTVGVMVYGYIDAGVSTGNLSLTMIQERITAWKALGAKGIFYDTFGYDYQVTRDRQLALADLVRKANMVLMVNVWQAQDVLEGNTPLQKDDVLVSEAFLLGNGQLYDMEAWKAKQAYLNKKKQAIGFKVFAVGTGGDTHDAKIREQQQFIWAGSILAEADYFYFSDKDYGAGSVKAYFYDPTWQLPPVITWKNELQFSRVNGLVTVSRASEVGQIKLTSDDKHIFTSTFTK